MINGTPSGFLESSRDYNRVGQSSFTTSLDRFPVNNANGKSLEISHFLFAENTLFCGGRIQPNVYMRMRCVVSCFEAIYYGVDDKFSQMVLMRTSIDTLWDSTKILEYVANLNRHVLRPNKNIRILAQES